MFRRKRMLKKLYARVELLLPAMMEPDPHPHTKGMYDGLNYAISVLEGRD